MKIIIIEDDPNKLKAVTSHLERNGDIDFITYSSFKTGLQGILSSTFDLLLLDMSVPAYDSGRPLPLAGRDILFLLKRKRISLKTIILTQYEYFDGVSLNNLHTNLRKEFPSNYLDYVYYNVTQDSWRDKLDALILEIKGHL